MEIQIGDQKFEVQVADNFWKRAKGLSFRKEGKMLFKFPGPTNAKIDMAFLSKPLYLYFFNSGGELIHVEKALPWSWNPKTWKLYSPDKKYQYLLESFEKLDLEEEFKLQDL